MPGKDNKESHRPSYLKDLILLFSIPAAVAVLAAAVIYGPRLFANPTSDFLYYSCREHRCDSRYHVGKDGLIVREKLAAVYGTQYPGEDPTIYYYDVQKDATRTITFEEARELRLDNSSRSPDGYVLTRENTGGGFLFRGSSDSGWYLKNGAAKKEVDLQYYDDYYYDEGEFLGWVKK